MNCLAIEICKRSFSTQETERVASHLGKLNRQKNFWLGTNTASNKNNERIFFHVSNRLLPPQYWFMNMKEKALVRSVKELNDFSFILTHDSFHNKTAAHRKNN